MLRPVLRRWLLTAHLWLGLLLGGFFALLGLTGSALVFYPEIDQMLNRELMIKVGAPVHIRYQAVVEQLRRQFPQRRGAWRIEAPRASDQPIFARYLKPEEKDPARFAPLIVAMDPHTLEIINSRYWGDYLMTWIYDLHYTLLLGPVGKQMVSAVGLLSLLIVCIGLLLWLPRGRDKLRKILPRIRSGAVKAIYDLHSLSGAYGALALAMLIVTGVGLATPQWISPLTDSFSRREAPVEPASVVRPDGSVRISADRAIHVALSRFPSAELRWIQPPASATDVYFVRMKQAGEPSDRFPKTYVWIDQFSAEILAVRDPLRVSSADQFFDWLHPLHNGEAFGLAGRWLMLLAGLLPMLLWVTGIVRWRQKSGSCASRHRQRGSGK